MRNLIGIAGGLILGVLVLGALGGGTPSSTPRGPLATQEVSTPSVPTAEPTPAISSEVKRLAAEAHVDSLALQGAVNATGLGPREYLESTGELARPAAISVSATVTAPQRVGSKTVITFEITNVGGTEIDGLVLPTDGPWDKVTLLQSGATVEPGLFSKVAAFHWQFVTIPPGQKRTPQLAFSPSEPGNYEFHFMFEDGHGQRFGHDGQRVRLAVTI
jgi:hypothetical protein